MLQQHCIRSLSCLATTLQQDRSMNLFCLLFFHFFRSCKKVGVALTTPAAAAIYIAPTTTMTMMRMTAATIMITRSNEAVCAEAGQGAEAQPSNNVIEYQFAASYCKIVEGNNVGRCTFI